MCRSPSTCTRQVEQPVLAERAEHVVVEPDPGGDVGRAGAVEVDLDSTLVSLVSPLDAVRSATPDHQHLLPERGPERRHLLAACRSTPAASRSGRLRGSARHGRAALPDARAGRRSVPNSTKLASVSAACSPMSRSQATVRRARPAARRPAPSSSAACAQRDPGDGLGVGPKVIGQPDDAHGVDHRRGGGEVAQPAAGERERLAHRAGHHQARVARAAATGRSASRPGGTRRRPRRRRPCPGAASRIASMSASGSAVPVGLLGEARNTTAGWCALRSRLSAAARSRLKSSRPATGHPLRVRCRGRTPGTSSRSGRTTARAPGPAEGRAAAAA